MDGVTYLLGGIIPCRSMTNMPGFGAAMPRLRWQQSHQPALLIVPACGPRSRQRGRRNATRAPTEVSTRVAISWPSSCRELLGRTTNTRDETRTRKTRRSGDFESPASTDSATRAHPQCSRPASRAQREQANQSGGRRPPTPGIPALRCCRCWRSSSSLRRSSSWMPKYIAR